MAISKLHRKIITELQTIYSIREASIMADWLFEKRANLLKADIVKNPEEILPQSTIRKINNDVIRLLNHEPIQYILEEAWFYKMQLYINKNVLIPRPETEEMVELMLKEITHNPQPVSIIDIGTGSGCIALSLKKQAPFASVTAVDISKRALDVAVENALTFELDIAFREINFLDESEWQLLRLYDYVVSNPPYIPFQEKDQLEKNVADYEPGIALFVPDDDPFIFYKKIAIFGQWHLSKNGKIFVEVHEALAYKVARLFSQKYKDVKVHRDMYGKSRFVTASQSR